LNNWFHPDLRRFPGEDGPFLQRSFAEAGGASLWHPDTQNLITHSDGLPLLSKNILDYSRNRRGKVIYGFIRLNGSDWFPSCTWSPTTTNNSTTMQDSSAGLRARALTKTREESSSSSVRHWMDESRSSAAASKPDF
jgi:hypothetical protein